MARLISALIVVSVAVAGVAFAVAMIGPRALDQSGHAPARMLRIVIEPDTRTLFFDHIRTFAKSHNFELGEDDEPNFPTGPSYYFDLDRSDIHIHCGDVTKDTGPIDPNGHTGAPPVTMDKSDYQVAFYNMADKSGRFPGPVDDMVNTFKSAMSDIKGIRIETKK